MKDKTANIKNIPQFFHIFMIFFIINESTYKNKVRCSKSDKDFKSGYRGMHLYFGSDVC